MAWILGNPLAARVPVVFVGYPMANSLATLGAVLLAMLALTWVPSRPMVVLRLLLPVVLAIYHGPLFLLRFAYLTHTPELLAPDRALYSLVNLFVSIVLLVISFGLILREAGLRLTTPSTGSGAPRAVSRLDAVYCSFVVWTTVGFGDIVPDTRAAKVVVMVEALYGYVTLGVLVSVFPALAAGVSETYFGTEM